MKRIMSIVFVVAFALLFTTSNACAEWIDARDYLPSNYVTDCSVNYASELQDAIDSANGNPVYLPKGCWRIDTGLTLGAGDRLIGDGKEQTLIQYYGSGVAISAMATAWPNQHLKLEGMTLRNMGSGTKGISVQGISFVQFSDLMVAGYGASHAWSSAGIEFDGSTYEMYNHSFYDVDVDCAATCISFKGITNEIAIHKGRMRFCGTGIKVDEASGIKFYGINFGTMSASCDSSQDGVGVEVLNGGAVQSFGSRFEYMHTAYKNVGSINTISSTGDTISATSITYNFHDGTNVNEAGVTMVGQRYGHNVGILATYARIREQPALLSLENPSYDTIEVKSTMEYARTFRVTNASLGVDYLTFRRDGAIFNIGSNSGAMSWKGNAPSTGTWSTGDRILNNNPSKDVNGMILTGWICTASGSPGTWEPMYVKTTSP